MDGYLKATLFRWSSANDLLYLYQDDQQDELVEEAKPKKKVKKKKEEKKLSESQDKLKSITEDLGDSSESSDSDKT